MTRADFIDAMRQVFGRNFAAGRFTWSVGDRRRRMRRLKRRQKRNGRAHAARKAAKR